MNRIKALFPKKERAGVFVGRQRTRDISFGYTTPSGIIGCVTRTHPYDVTAEINDGTTPVQYFGLACVDTAVATCRGIVSTDTTIAGFVVKPFPSQVASATNYGASAVSTVPTTAPASPVPSALVPVPPGIMNVLRSGFMTVYCNGAQSANKTLTPYVWTAASTGNHLQGGLEIAPSATVASAATAGNTGNGTMSAPTVNAASAQAGAYVVTFSSATAFGVVNPQGVALANGATGKAYNDGGVSFTITAGGTAFAAGDSFTVTVTAQTIALPFRSYFNGPGDLNGAVELAFNL